MLKICSSCKDTKSLNLFNTNKNRKDKLDHYCKECRRIYDRKRANNPVRLAQMKVASLKHSLTGKNDDTRRKRKKLYPERYLANSLVARAVKSGILERQPCTVCNEPKSEAHHADYTKPFEVNWLCRQHHMLEHRK